MQRIAKSTGLTYEVSKKHNTPKIEHHVFNKK